MLKDIVPTVGFVILFRNYMRGRCAPLDRAIVYVYGPLRILLGISSGWLGPVLNLVIVCGVVYLTERKKIPLVEFRSSLSISFLSGREVGF